MVNSDLIAILRCPSCVQQKGGALKMFKDSWLICAECGRKYPIVEDIPVMLIAEGEKWQKIADKDLPIPPPKPE